MGQLIKEFKSKKEALDLTQFKEEAVRAYHQYKQMLILSFLVRDSEGSQTNEAALYVDKQNDILRGKHDELAKGGWDKMNEVDKTWFFSNENFYKRLQLHKAEVCTSTTKRAQSDEIYFLQLGKEEKLLNFLDIAHYQRKGQDWFKKKEWL